MWTTQVGRPRADTQRATPQDVPGVPRSIALSTTTGMSLSIPGVSSPSSSMVLCGAWSLPVAKEIACEQINTHILAHTTSAHVATDHFCMRFMVSSSHAETSGVPLESSGLRFSSARSFEYTSQSLEFTDGPVPCRLSSGREPSAVISRSAFHNYNKLN